jgi:rubrerythrin
MFMDLQDYSLDDLLMTAIKSEEDSYQLYSSLHDVVEDREISDKLKLLANEETGHKDKLLRIFKERFPDREMDYDMVTDVPLPWVDLAQGYMPIGDLLGQVMTAELITSDFYSSWKSIYPKEDEVSETLEWLSQMERSHYEIIRGMKKIFGERGNPSVKWEGI